MAPEFVPGQRWGSLVDHAAIAAAAEEDEGSHEQDELDFQFDEELEETASPPHSSGSENSHVGSPKNEAGVALGQAEQVTFDAEEYVAACHHNGSSMFSLVAFVLSTKSCAPPCQPVPIFILAATSVAHMFCPLILLCARRASCSSCVALTSASLPIWTWTGSLFLSSAR
jgi:hypothetical protein